ncbi:MAG TPA: HNH endonuclease signature motif containing protein [Saprospiraceae bacterium]|nr:HNH endonuclease signature motif containing protein [Saprospiraceae bacterium]HMP25223.1 HNH endonuclease signature motif containing protein [Saprospiraceae bacterium]
MGGAVSGAVVGGVVGGFVAWKNNTNLWTGKPIEIGRTRWSFNNSANYSKAKGVVEIGDVIGEWPDGKQFVQTRGTIHENLTARVQAKISLYPDVIDPRTGSKITLPHVNEIVPEGARVPWGRIERATFIKEWHSRGFPRPKGGWGVYDIHHITPRAYGGTNDFWNLVPVERNTHKLFNNFWRLFGGL